jgi:hypothetical protein
MFSHIGGMRMSFQIKTCVAAACIGLSFVIPTAESWAQSDELQLKRSFGLRGSGESHVQMRAILAPVKRKASSRTTAKIPVTPVLTVVEKDKVGYV